MKDVHLTDAVRTPFGKYGGALAGVRPDDLAAHALRGLLARTPGPAPARIDDVLRCRLAGTVAHQLARKGSGTGVAILRVGAGQGLALVLER
nr:hypothetical protein StreXyl84_09770 [Streptomyces sp. Xyl84]